MSKQDKPATDSEQRVDIKVIAADLSVSTRTVRRWIAAGDLPAFQALKGGRIRVLLKTYRRFLRTNTKGRDDGNDSE